MIKSILRQTIDLIFGIIALVLLIIYMVDIGKNGIGADVNFTGYLLLVVGYVANNVINKVRLIRDSELIKRNDG